MKYTVTSVIPVAQYANIQPSIEVEADTLEQAQAIVEPQVQALWEKYSPGTLKTSSGTTKRLKDIFGNEIDYDEANHIYSWKGEKYLSGSEYAKKNQKAFNALAISEAVAKKTGANPADIANLWSLGGKVSREFGTVVHQALEIYGKYKELSDSLGKEYHLPNHPLLKNAVEAFYKGREAEKAEYEVLVVDHASKRAGTIDRLQIIAPLGTSSLKTVVVEDFKITHKDDLSYWTDQLTFYQGIIEANGWKVKGKTIHKYDGDWKEVAL